MHREESPPHRHLHTHTYPRYSAFCIWCCRTFQTITAGDGVKSGGDARVDLYRRCSQTSSFLLLSVITATMNAEETLEVPALTKGTGGRAGLRRLKQKNSTSAASLCAASQIWSYCVWLLWVTNAIERDSVGLQTKDPNYLLSLFHWPMLSASQEAAFYISGPSACRLLRRITYPPALEGEEKMKKMDELIRNNFSF